ncbi:MAG: S26 family signal peptidase [Ardenticatenaceae bacterium]
MWILGVYKRYRITGRSMLPLLPPRDEVLVRRQASYCVGDIVVAKHPYDGERFVVKRITILIMVWAAPP